MNSNERARVIAEWRGLPEHPFPSDTSQPIGPLLANLLKELGLSGRMREEEVLRAWREIVGDFLAEHSTPQRLVDGVLQVRVLQPAMRYEMETTWRAEIVRKLRERFGRAVRDVKFRVG
jgi:predicted nucleic acid-binding Zn ribbon protein